ncbi:hypothetical protein KKB99_00030, partial [bacterium]|nr:hypothetical protein [bacterium]MBU1024371.1 hypothetical protein [bacterium]
LAALGVYVYIDYDNVKCWITGQERVKTIEKSDESEYSPPKEIVKKEIPKQENKFKVGDVVYVDASVGDHIIWKQNMVPLWKTYDGSEHEEYQKVTNEIPHRLQVRITRCEKGRDDIFWYYVRTAKGLPTEGWIIEKYLSEKLPKRRDGKTDDWGM